MNDSVVTISIISHGQALIARQLLEDLDKFCIKARVILTYNLPEKEIPLSESLASRTTVLRNPAPKGFGANHNAAFMHCDTPYFCVLNPDIRFIENPYDVLIAAMEKFRWVISSPLIFNPEGDIEDNCRVFPTPWGMILRKAGLVDGRWPFDSNEEKIEPHWIAGMFLLIKREHYVALSGFDERYFMYCEDIDLCARTRRMGLSLGAVTSTRAVHNARRDSSKSYRYLRWHISSLIRFWTANLGRLP